MTLVPKLDYRVISDLLATLDCPRALTILIMLRYSEYDQIVAQQFNPLHYNSLEIARNSLQATELLRKHEDIPTTIDKKAVAIDSFLQGERQCTETNNRLLVNHSRDDLIFSVRRKIASILGDFDAEEFFELGGWGPGVTLTRKGRDATITNKFRHYVELTRPLSGPARSWIGAISPRWQPQFKFFEGNRVITVPKNAKTDRVIAVEPSLNLWFQKSIGAMIRSRLRRTGIDLNSQSLNQFMAAIASMGNDFATVDFSAASDTISYRTIMELLPIKWFEVLDILRSPRGYLSGSLFEYEKFSSMGNGFTFELESLIFYAIAVCVSSRSRNPEFVSIYGDDLIVPCDVKNDLLDAFAFFGFTINTRKSYFDSYYRESCGKHYWDGSDITPVYLRRYLSVTREIYSFHNRVVALARRTVARGFRDKRFRGVIQLLRSSVPERERLPIPVGFSDGGFACDLSEAHLMRPPRFHRGYQAGYIVKHVIARPRTRVEDDDAVLLTGLYIRWKGSVGDGHNDVVYSNNIGVPRREKYVLARGFVRDWQDIGYWI
jgi:hypothetical protein